MAIFANKVWVRKPVEAKASSVEIIEETLGVKVLPDAPGVVYNQGVTRMRRSGGKSRGYCPARD